MAKPVVRPPGAYPKNTDKFRYVDASTQSETDRGRVANARKKNPRGEGVGTAAKSYELKYGRKP